MLIFHQFKPGSIFSIEPGHRFEEEKELILLLATEFTISHNKKVASIAEHAEDEFPTIVFGETPFKKIVSQAQKLGACHNRSCDLLLKRGFTDWAERSNLKEHTTLAKERFMKEGVRTVLNETANLLTKHELGDLDWLIVNKVYEQTED